MVAEAGPVVKRVSERKLSGPGTIAERLSLPVSMSFPLPNPYQLQTRRLKCLHLLEAFGEQHSHSECNSVACYA